MQCKSLHTNYYPHPSICLRCVAETRITRSKNINTIRLHIPAAKLFSTEIIPIYVFRVTFATTSNSLPTITQLSLGGLKKIVEISL